MVVNTDCKAIEFPVSEKRYHNIKANINVFGRENKQVYPIYLSKENLENHVESLLLLNKVKLQWDSYKFMYNKTKHKSKKQFCMKCLRWFSSEEVLKNYKNFCSKNKQATKMPEKGSSVQCSNYYKQLKTTFAFYLHFESNLKEVQKPNRDTVDAF